MFGSQRGSSIRIPVAHREIPNSWAIGSLDEAANGGRDDETVPVGEGAKTGACGFPPHVSGRAERITECSAVVSCLSIRNRG